MNTNLNKKSAKPFSVNFNLIFVNMVPNQVLTSTNRESHLTKLHIKRALTVFSDKHVKDWTEDDVISWLSELSIPPEVIDDMRRLRHNGVSLLILNRRNFEPLQRHIPQGPLLIIQDNFEQLLQKLEDGNQSEPVNEGAADAANEKIATNQFEKNSQYQKVSGITYRLLIANCETSEERQQFAKDLMRHISACLNEGTMSKIVNGVNDAGIVQGFCIGNPEDDLEEFCARQLKMAFCDQQDIVQPCVTFSKVFPVTFGGQLADAHIFEVTVSPSDELCANMMFKVKLSTSTGKKKKKKIAYRYEGRELRIMKEKGEARSSRDAANTSRKNSEKKAVEDMTKISKQMTSTDADLSAGMMQISEQQKLRNLMIAENDNNAGDLYPILLVNAPKATKDANAKEDQENMALIGEIPWKAVFDFDSSAILYKNSEEKKQYRITIVPDVDWFSPKSKRNIADGSKLISLQKDVEKSLQDHLQNEYHGPQWIFGNGFNSLAEKQVDAVSWKRAKEAGFKEALKLYDDLIPNERAVIVVMLLSEDTEIILETLTEVTSVFQDKWIVVGDRKNYEGTMQELKRRNCISERDIEDRCIAGLSLSEIHRVFQDVFKFKYNSDCELPINIDGKITAKKMDQKKLCQLKDIELLSINKGEELFLENSEANQQLIEQEELKYYNGCEVSWLNFRAKDHVFERKLVRKLQERIEKATKPDIVEENPLGRVTFHHLPGAGGTTVAQHTLWKLRQQYRCAILKHITEDTAEQIRKLWEDGYENSHNQPDPVVVLADNVEEDSLTGLLIQLEDKAKQLVRRVKSEEATTAVFVFLICMRKTKLPPTSFRLGYTLSEEELLWWRHKYQALEDRAKSGTTPDHLKIRPDSLISFNIMKSGFDKEVIKKMADMFVKNITLPKERELLKYVALLNAFDLRFDEIPAAVFDTFMADFEKEKTPDVHSKQTNTVFYQSAGPTGFIQQRRGMSMWVNHLSSEFKVLMNDPTPYQQKKVTNLRLVHPSLSKHVLNVLQDKDGDRKTIADMMKQFLDCKVLFNVRGVARNKILDKMVDLVTKREQDPWKKSPTKFSPLLQHIISKEHFADALEIAEKVFELSNVAFVAQLIARLYIEYKNWTRAEIYADKAVAVLQNNSALWDTFGRVYKGHLLEMVNRRKLKQDDMFKGIKFAAEGIKCFQKSQKLSKKETYGYGNNAGYQGEVEMGALLIHYLTMFQVFKNRSVLADTLNRRSSFPKEVEIMCKENSDYGKAMGTLREINSNLDLAVASFEEELLHLKDRKVIPQSRAKENENNVKKMQEVKANIYSYRGTAETLTDAVDEESCHMRRAYMRHLGANSFTSVLELADEPAGLQKLSHIRQMCCTNLSSGLATPEDYTVMLETSLALLQHNHTNGILYKDLVMWSRELYKRREILNEKKINLEPHLFYAMLNWPRKNNTCSTMSETELGGVLKSWRHDFYEKYPRQKKSNRSIYKKEITTVFFLAKGQGVNSVVTYKILKSKVKTKGDEFWKHSYVKQKLQRFTGKAMEDDIKVWLEDSQGNKHMVDIPTSLPIEKSMNYRDVYFAIGFTWNGPKAYDVTEDEPSAEESETDAEAELEEASNQPKPRSSMIILNDLQAKIDEVNAEMEALGKTTLTNEEVSEWMYFFNV